MKWNQTHLFVYALRRNSTRRLILIVSYLKVHFIAQTIPTSLNSKFLIIQSINDLQPCYFLCLLVVRHCLTCFLSSFDRSRRLFEIWQAGMEIWNTGKKLEGASHTRTSHWDIFSSINLRADCRQSTATRAERKKHTHIIRVFPPWNGHRKSSAFYACQKRWL